MDIGIVDNKQPTVGKILEDIIHLRLVSVSPESLAESYLARQLRPMQRGVSVGKLSSRAHNKRPSEASQKSKEDLRACEQIHFDFGLPFIREADSLA